MQTGWQHMPWFDPHDKRPHVPVRQLPIRVPLASEPHLAPLLMQVQDIAGPVTIEPHKLLSKPLHPGMLWFLHIT